MSIARPAPPRHIEQQRAGRVGDVGRVLAAQAEADVVLRQQHVADAVPHFGSCARTQSSFVSVKLVSAGFDVSSSKRSRADRVVQPAALVFGALIAPDDRRAHDLAALVQQHRAVHLAGKPDGRHAPGCASLAQHGRVACWHAATSRPDPARPMPSAAIEWRMVGRRRRDNRCRPRPGARRASRWCRRRCRERKWLYLLSALPAASTHRARCHHRRSGTGGRRFQR